MAGPMNWSALVAAVLLTACASYPSTKQLGSYDLKRGYRFEKLPLAPPDKARNSDELFVVLAFSGGGTRAASLSYGVLAQLREVKFRWDPVKKEPVSCATLTAAQCASFEERSLLDEVDVISTVSGGSFTSAYYALYGDDIFRPESRFQKDFLYHPVQSDLMKSAVYDPRSWRHLRSRIEIAADYYAKHVFLDKTYADLTRRSRPYIVLNSTDASTGARFEFTQEQFDLLCADLDSFPVARAVAASSAFPVLLNSMTVDSYNHQKPGCEYKYSEWVDLAIKNPFINFRRYNTARELIAYRDSTRKHLHILDGGLADNIGLRGVLQSLGAPDRPVDDAGNVGGWNLLNKIADREVKKIIVITVNAKTNKTKKWDAKATGPGIVQVVDASASIPMGNFTTETLELLREFGINAGLNGGRERPDSSINDFAPRLYAVEVAFANIENDDQRAFFDGLGTNFQLPAIAVKCLVGRGARLLRESSSVADAMTQSFEDFVKKDLSGSIGEAQVPADTACTVAKTKSASRGIAHTVDVGVQYNVKLGLNGATEDAVKSVHNIGLLLRVAKPNGLGATLGVTRESFVVPGQVGDDSVHLGRLRLWAATAGVVLSRSFKPVQANLSLAAGYSFAAFRLSDGAREAFVRSGTTGMKAKSQGALLFRPGASVWLDLSEKVAATVAASYIMTQPTLRFESGGRIPDQKLKVNALRVSAGIGYRIF